MVINYVATLGLDISFKDPKDCVLIQQTTIWMLVHTIYYKSIVICIVFTQSNNLKYFNNLY